MKNSNDKAPELVPVPKCLAALGHSFVSPSRTKHLIKTCGIDVVAEMPYGRGVMRLMKRSQMEELVIAHQAKKQPVVESPAPPPESEVQVHIGALETKIDRLVQTLAGNSQAVAELIRAQNVLADNILALATDPRRAA